MATGQSDEPELTVDKKKSKLFSKPKMFKKSKTHPDKHSDTPKSPPVNTPKPLPVDNPEPPPVDTPKPLLVDDQAWVMTSNKQNAPSMPSHVSHTQSKVNPSTKKEMFQHTRIPGGLSVDESMQSTHLQVSEGNTSREFSLLAEKTKLEYEKLDLETERNDFRQEHDELQNTVENLKKEKSEIILELNNIKKELQQTKENMEKQKKDASNALSILEAENATRVAQLELDIQEAKNEVRNTEEYWSKPQTSKEIELKEKYLNSQEEWTKKEREATASKLAIEKQFIRVQTQYEEQQKRIQQLEKELATAHEEMRFKDRTIGELNGRIKEKNEASNQLKGDTVTLKEKDEKIKSLQHTRQLLNEQNTKKDEDLFNMKAEFDKMRTEFDGIKRKLQEKEEENEKLVTDVVNIAEKTEQQCREQFEKEFQETINQEQDKVNDATVKIENLEKQKEEIITQHRLELQQKEDAIEELQIHLLKYEDEARVNNEQLSLQTITDSSEKSHSQSAGGAGASPHTSLSEEGKKLADLYDQVAAKDDKIADLEKQLYVKTMESTSLQETQRQLEQMMQRGEESVQQRTVTPDHMALIAQMNEYDKALQDIEAEKRAMKSFEAKNMELVMEVDRLKQELLQFKKDAQSGTGVSGVLTRPSTYEEATTYPNDFSDENSSGLLTESEGEAKKLVDVVDDKDKSLEEITAKYDDLLTYTKDISQALKEREEHINRQGARIAQLRKEAKYYQSENEKLAALNKRLDDGGYQLQEETSTAQKTLRDAKIQENALSSENELKLQLKVSQAKVQEQAEELQIAKTHLQKITIEHSQLHNDFNAKQRMIEGLQQQLQVAQHELKYFPELNKKVSEELEIQKNQSKKLAHKVLSLENDIEIEKAQAQLYKEDFINERADRTKAHEEYSEDIIQYKATIKQLKDDLGKYATTITQLEKVKKSLRENEDVKKNWDEERAATDQQLRAYKRQVDDLRRLLNEEKENKKKLQESLDKKTGDERKITEYDAKVHDLQKKIHDLQAQLADELKSKDHIMGGVQTLQQQVHTLQQQLSEANRKYQEEMEKMRNANMRLQHKLRESWDEQAALNQELMVLRQVGRTHQISS